MAWILSWADSWGCTVISTFFRLLEIKTQMGLLGQVGNSGLLATKKILSSCENRMQYGG